MTAGEMEQLALFMAEVEKAEMGAGMFFSVSGEEVYVVDSEGRALAHVLFNGKDEHDITVHS